MVHLAARSGRLVSPAGSGVPMTIEKSISSISRIRYLLPSLAVAALFPCLSMADTAAPAPATPFWKNISLDDGAQLSFDGSLRERYEWSDHRDLNGGRDSVFMERFLLGARLDASPWFSSYVQLGSSLASTRTGGSEPTDKNNAYVAQAYADLKWPAADYGSGQLRTGRQEIPLGSLHLLGTRDGPNVRRAFDAVRGSWSWQDNKLDVFGGYPIEIEQSSFLDHTLHSQKIWGIYGTTHNKALSSGIDLYYLGFENDDATYVEGSGRERRYTLGARIFGNQSGFDWDNEAAWQYGHFNQDDINAWSASVHAGYTFASVAWSPRIGIKTGIASGDKHPGDGKLNTFNAMYPKLPYLTENGIVAPANLIDVSPSLQVTPREGLLLDLSWHTMWRQQKNDAFWIAPGRPVNNTTGDDRYIGQQAQIEATWTPVSDLQFDVAWAYFEVSHNLQTAGLRNMNFVMTSATFFF